jgi:hypothetical protein
MCPKQYALMSRTRAAFGGVAIGTTAVQVFGQDPHRVSVIISPLTGDTISVTFGDRVFVNPAIVVKPADVPRVLRFEEYGSYLQMPIFAWTGTAANTSVGIMCISVHPDDLARFLGR